MSRGRSSEANKQLEQWLSGIKDRRVAGRVEQAFGGKICKDDRPLLEELKRMQEQAALELRVETVRVLAMLGGEEAMRSVRLSLRDASPVVRRQALVGIDYACDQSALPDVLRLIEAEQSADVLSYAQEVAERLKGDVPCVAIPGLQADQK